MITHPKKCPHCGYSKQPWLTTMQNSTDTEHLVWDCCGAIEKLEPKHCLVTFGKCEGLTIDEIDDAWYLNFLSGVAQEKGDWVMSKCIELKQA